MIKRQQYDMGIESARVQAFNIQGVSIDTQKTYLESQIITDIGERLDRAESHYILRLPWGSRRLSAVLRHRPSGRDRRL